MIWISISGFIKVPKVFLMNFLLIKTTPKFCSFSPHRNVVYQLYTKNECGREEVVHAEMDYGALTVK